MNQLNLLVIEMLIGIMRHMSLFFVNASLRLGVELRSNIPGTS